MRRLKKVMIAALVSGIFIGCAEPEYQTQRSAFIVLKTPTMRYADQGFIYENEDEVKAEIYANGQAVFSLRITPEKVCEGTFACVTHTQFNERMLSKAYPDGIVEKIFRGEPIFEGRRLRRTRNGFTQKLVVPYQYQIEYSVLNNMTIFRDTINHILIKIKRL